MAAAEAPRASASSAEDRLLQSLADRGWRFRDPADEAADGPAHGKAQARPPELAPDPDAHRANLAIGRGGAGTGSGDIGWPTGEES